MTASNTISNDSKEKISSAVSLHEQVAQWESQLLNENGNMSLHDAEDLLMRCVKLSQVLVAKVQTKQKVEQDKQGQTRRANTVLPNRISQQESKSAPSNPIPIPSEVLRLLIPHLTANEMGRLFLLTSHQLVLMLGHNFVWKELCLKLWPDSLRSPLGAAAEWMTTTTTTSTAIDNTNTTATITNNHQNHNEFRWYFLQRQKSILLQQDERLKPLPKPKWNPDYLTLGIDIYNDKGELVHTRTIDNFLSHVDDFVSNGTVTMHLEEPITVGNLPRGRGCHCWNLPKSYPGWRARLHLFANNVANTKEGDDYCTSQKASGGDDSTNSCNGRQCHTMLDTGFSVWRGFSENGELTFIQKERTKGLQLTDRGRFLQHRIATGASKTPNWKNFLGLQAKVILVCEKTYSDVNTETTGGNDQSPTQQFGFTSLRIQAIRLHETAVGNVQHSLYRKDSNWHTHGVELLHLLEELM
ncbi:MAG: hypothetical protein SGBAC_005664 [Bacillariaceae sp.]